MASFMKVLFRNLLQGPSTDPFPLGETFTPERLRGKAVVDPDLCVGCGVCKNVCAAGAIDITPKEDKTGYTISIWRNSCCLCASCRHYCPTGAMSIINDWHSAHVQEEKYGCVEQQTIDFVPCTQCGTLIRPLSRKMAEKLYADDKDIDQEKIRLLCPQCRQLADGRRIEGKPEAALEKAAAGETLDLKQSEKAPAASESQTN